MPKISISIFPLSVMIVWRELCSLGLGGPVHSVVLFLLSVEILSHSVKLILVILITLQSWAIVIIY